MEWGLLSPDEISEKTSLFMDLLLFGTGAGGLLSTDYDFFILPKLRLVTFMVSSFSNIPNVNIPPQKTLLQHIPCP
jgi:hypothetical protein